MGSGNSSVLGIYKSIYDGTQKDIDYKKLTPASKEFVNLMTDYILREYEAARNSINNGKLLMSTDTDENLKDKVVCLEKLFHDICKKGHILTKDEREALIYDHIQSGRTMNERMATMVTREILYSEVYYSAGIIINRSMDKDNITLQILRLPTVYQMLNDDIAEITLESVSKDLLLILETETYINGIFAPCQYIADRLDELSSYIHDSNVALYGEN